MTTPGGGIGYYLWRAFTTRWNLLAVFGGTVAAMLTPWPDVLLPLIGAGELIYLGGLVSLPRYREAIDAQVADKARAQIRAQAPTLNQLLLVLNTDAQQRFNGLRRRCLEMRSIARTTRPDTVDGTTDAWTPALDRLLYGFLRLLGHQNSLLRFLGLTTSQELTKRRDDLTKRLADAKGSGDDRMIRSLEESTAIADQRLDNYQKAVKNADFAALELDRVEAKIQALIELAANRQDPDFLSSQVDAAAASMDHTEATLNQLQQITGGDGEKGGGPALPKNKIAALSTAKTDPGVVLALLARFVRNNIVSADKAIIFAVIIDQASFLFPSGEPGRTSFPAAAMLVTLLNWAKSPHVKKMPMAFVLMDERRADVSERLSAIPHLASIEIPPPAGEQRERFIKSTIGARQP